jgi:hypothetical protein
VSNRKLKSDEAFEAYLVYQVRVMEFFQIFQILLDIQNGTYCPERQGPEPPATTVLTYVTGIFVSLVDTQKQALNVFDVWQALYPPHLQAEIIGVRKAIDPTLNIIRDYRNNVAFHANMKLKEYVKAMQDFRNHRGNVVAAIQEFLSLAEKLMKEQGRIPDYESRLDSALRSISPNASPEKLQTLKEYFIHS